MKNSRKTKVPVYEFEFDEYDLAEERKRKRTTEAKRREIRNWKKAWSEHPNDYDEVDDFYMRR